jgi:tRNA (uracil-5-)-methyltransferase
MVASIHKKAPPFLEFRQGAVEQMLKLRAPEGAVDAEGGDGVHLIHLLDKDVEAGFAPEGEFPAPRFGARPEVEGAAASRALEGNDAIQLQATPSCQKSTQMILARSALKQDEAIEHVEGPKVPVVALQARDAHKFQRFIGSRVAQPAAEAVDVGRCLPSPHRFREERGSPLFVHRRPTHFHSVSSLVSSCGYLKRAVKSRLPSIDLQAKILHDPAMKFGDELRGKIERLDEKGRGVFTYQLPQANDGSRTVVVPFSAIGDEVRATFVKRDQGTWIGRLQEVVSPSADRVKAPCPHAGVCGGCLWQHMAYEAQLRLKKDLINQAFGRSGHEERIKEVVPSVDLLYYRNRMDYAIGWKGEIGLKEYGSWSKYLDLSTCLLLDKDTPRILQRVRELMRERSWEAWDAKKHTGQMRYVVIRLGKNTNERMVMVVVKDRARFTDADRQSMVERLSPLCTTLYLGENPKVTDLSFVETLDLLHGKDYLEEEVNGMRYQIHPNSFFQTNTAMAATLQKTVLDFIGPLSGKSVLDLYCGLGFFGIACAKQGASVYGHELDAQAIELAKKNAEINGVSDRTRFGAGPVEDLSAELVSAFQSDAVILDPPRAGLHPKALKLILDQAPSTIVYVSCNYRRLVEELKIFKEKYKIERLSALDLFPQTPHVEVVVKLVRK